MRGCAIPNSCQQSRAERADMAREALAATPRTHAHAEKRPCCAVKSNTVSLHGRRNDASFRSPVSGTACWSCRTHRLVGNVGRLRPGVGGASRRTQDGAQEAHCYVSQWHVLSPGHHELQLLRPPERRNRHCDRSHFCSARDSGCVVNYFRGCGPSERLNRTWRLGRGSAGFLLTCHRQVYAALIDRRCRLAAGPGVRVASGG